MSSQVFLRHSTLHMAATGSSGMPFVLKMSQDIFQARIDQFVEGLTGVVAIADDIMIFGAPQEEHDQNLRRLPRAVASTGRS